MCVLLTCRWRKTRLWWHCSYIAVRSSCPPPAGSPTPDVMLTLTSCFFLLDPSHTFAFSSFPFLLDFITVALCPPAPPPRTTPLHFSDKLYPRSLSSPTVGKQRRNKGQTKLDWQRARSNSQAADTNILCRKCLFRRWRARTEWSHHTHRHTHTHTRTHTEQTCLVPLSVHPVSFKKWGNTDFPVICNCHVIPFYTMCYTSLFK